jgi:ectoine hydroxylase
MLTASQLDTYRTDGYVLVSDVVAADDLAQVRQDVERLFTQDHPGRIMEKDGVTVRGIHGCHQVSTVFDRLTRLPGLLTAAEQILDGKVYVHQSKVNAKLALRGDVWPWHQDYIYWEREDGMSAPRALNIALFLDDATHFNGPLLFLPGSHLLGTVSTAARNPGHGWQANLVADLRYQLTPEQLAPLAADMGMRAATGSAGTLLFFDPRLIHGSGTNMSPVNRRLLLITYNSVENTLVPVAEPRPEFLAARDNTPLAVWDAGLDASCR